MPRRIGVLAIQGDFARHLAALARCGVSGIEVRTVEDLGLVEKLIIPGGESTTVGMLLERFGLGPALVERAQAGMPIWGTCMGMILMAREIEGSSQPRLGLLDITVRRNAFGAQVHSFEGLTPVTVLEEPLEAVYIRAPVVTEMGSGVEAIAHWDGQVVGVRQGLLIGTSFHPELTEDKRLHKWFLTL